MIVVLPRVPGYHCIRKSSSGINVNFMGDSAQSLTNQLSQPHFELCLMIMWATVGACNEKLCNGKVERPDIITSRALSWW